MKKLLASLLCAVTLLGLLSGCGTSAEPTGGAGSPPPASQETETPAVESSPLPEGQEAAPTESESSPAPETPPAEPETGPAPEEEETDIFAGGETTLMIYMIGSDLESRSGEATADLQEIADSGVDPETNHILVCAGGTEHWHNEWMDAESETLLHLTADGFEKLGSLPLQSMGDPACLAAFVNFCTEQYPAEHYALILWDHGNGPVMGYGLDSRFGKDSLTLAEMREAMEQTPFAGELRLDWVGFDACLMASAELACVWGDYADYMVSSQEVEPFFGWNYAFLASCGSLSPRKLSCSIADAYLEYAETTFAANAFFREDVTMSVLDLSRAGELEEAVNALFRTAANDVSGDYVRLAQARAGSRDLGRSSTGSDYDLVDLQTVAESLASAYPEESAALLAVLDDMVVYTVSNTPQCCGMSIYYPFYNKQYYRQAWKDSYRELALFPDYLKYLERFEQIWLGSDMKRFFSDALELQAGAVPSTYTLQLTPEQAEVYASADYYILNRCAESLYTVVYCSSDVTMEDGVLTAVFDGNVIYCESDYGTKNIPILRMWDTVGGVSSYTAIAVTLKRGSFLSPDYESLHAEIRFSVDHDSGDLEVKGIYSTEDQDQFSGGKQEAISLSDWDSITFVRDSPRSPVRDSNGTLLPYWDWPEQSILWGFWFPVADNPHFSFEPLYDDGTEYYILFNIRDLQGNRFCSELFPIQLAPAPEQEEAPAEELVWEAGDSVTLLDLGEVQFGLTAVQDFASGNPVYYLTGTNRSDRPVSLQLSGGALINDDYTSRNSLASLDLSPGSSSSCLLRELAKGAALSSREGLRSLECSYTVEYNDDHSTMAKGRFRLTLPAPQELSVRWNEVLEARAEEQPLLDAQGVSVSLLAFGEPYGGSPLASLRLENHSGSDRDLVIYGLCFDDILIDSRTSLTLADGNVWFPVLYLDAKAIASLGYTGDFFLDEDLDSLPHLSSIPSVSLLLEIDGTLYTCPVSLLAQGDQAPIPAEGQTLYQDELLEVRLFRHVQIAGDGWNKEVWYLWVINRSDHMIDPDLYFPNTLPFPLPSGWGLIQPGGQRFCSYYDSSRVGKAYSIWIRVDGKILQPIALPAN